MRALSVLQERGKNYTTVFTVMRLDLNADMGESFGAYRLGQDALLMPAITSANVACGFHAGDPGVMRETVSAGSPARCCQSVLTPGFLTSLDSDGERFERRRARLKILSCTRSEHSRRLLPLKGCAFNT